MDAIVRPAGNLTQDEVRNMLHLMQEYYLNVNEDDFSRDLAEKDKVILLLEADILCGFSTWKLFRHRCDGRQVNVIYSGDTITARDHRTSFALPIAWGHLMFNVLEKDNDNPLFWLLTSKGYKTYRFLPVFFKSFYPSYLHKAPDFERSLIVSLAGDKFGDRFNPETFVVRAQEDAQRLRPGVADVTQTRLKDEHVAFFYRSNPHYARGDELVCLARCDPDNITSFMLRQLGK